MKASPWVDAFSFPTRSTDRFERRAVLASVSYKDLDADFEAIRSGMLGIFLCSERVKQVTREMLAVGEGHAKLYYNAPKDGMRLAVAS